MKDEQEDSAPPLKVFSLQTTGGDKEGYPILIKRCVRQADTFTHEHVFHEIVFVEEGTAEHQSCEGVRRLVAGDIIVIRPRIWHRYFNTQNFQIINCLFDRTILIDQKVFLSMAKGAFDLVQRPVQCPVRTPPTFLHATPQQREAIVETLNGMIQERREKRIDWEGSLMAHLLNLIIQISRVNNEPYREEALSHSNRNLANMLLVYLEGHFREEITLSQLSTQFRSSPSHLSRIFKKRIGIGIIEYINHLRIEAACKLLRTTDWTASQIALDVGYEEIPYFFRRFRRELRTSPLEYRKAFMQ